MEMKEGIMLQITSWENDGDYYNTKTKYGLSEEEANFWLALAKLCGDKYANIYMESSREEEFKRGQFSKDFLALVKTHHVGFNEATKGWNTACVDRILDENSSEYENEVDDIVSLASELVYDILGCSAYYSFRVFDGYKAYFIPEDVFEVELGEK